MLFVRVPVLALFEMQMHVISLFQIQGTSQDKRFEYHGRQTEKISHDGIPGRKGMMKLSELLYCFMYTWLVANVVENMKVRVSNPLQYQFYQYNELNSVLLT